MSDGGLTLLKVLAKAVSASEDVVLGVGAATASVAETLLGLVRLQIANDVGALKQHLLTRSAAKATGADADARKRVAEALDAENHATLASRRDVFARAERRKASAEALKAEAEARKALAEADVIEGHATVVHLQSEILTRALLIADPDEVERSAVVLKQALRRLNAKGGGLFVDARSLQRHIDKK
jgi:hypothetical protein